MSLNPTDHSSSPMRGRALAAVAVPFQINSAFKYIADINIDRYCLCSAFETFKHCKYLHPPVALVL